MRQSKKAERSMGKLMDMLAASGTTTEAIEEMKTNAPTGREALSRQGEAVLLFLESPAKYTAKLCKRCGEAFGTNYRAVAYCSDSCRAKTMYEQLGVKWNNFKTEEERWGGEPPLIIPPEALQRIQQLVAWFADNLPTQTETKNPLPLNPEGFQSASYPTPYRSAEQSVSPLRSEAHTNLGQWPLEQSPESKSEEEPLFDF